jgi:hypothetical protein
MPTKMPSILRFRLMLLANGSSLVMLISAIWTLVGSHLAPAPIEEKTGMEFLWQWASRSDLVVMLSIQSRTQSAPERRAWPEGSERQREMWGVMLTDTGSGVGVVDGTGQWEGKEGKADEIEGF